MYINNIYASNVNNNETFSVQETESSPQKSKMADSTWATLIPMIFIFVLFYFLLIRPQEKRKRMHASLISGIKKGERIITNSGLFGKITAIKDDDTITLQIADGVEVKVLKASIANLDNNNDNAEKNQNNTAKNGNTNKLINKKNKESNVK